MSNYARDFWDRKCKNRTRRLIFYYFLFLYETSHPIFYVWFVALCLSNICKYLRSCRWNLYRILGYYLINLITNCYDYFYFCYMIYPNYFYIDSIRWCICDITKPFRNTEKKRWWTYQRTTNFVRKFTVSNNGSFVK